jgi:hypothetical protein
MGVCLAIAWILLTFIGRYQVTHVPSRDRCVATVLHATILKVKESEKISLYVINSSKCQENVWGSEGIVLPRHNVVVNVQLHDL